MKQTKMSREKSGDFSAIVDELIEEGAIEKPSRYKFRLLAPGFEQLKLNVQDPQFGFEGGSVGTRFVNPLMKLFRHMLAEQKEVKEKVQKTTPEQGQESKLQQSEMSFEEFADTFHDLYKRTRKDQAMRGAIAIRQLDIKQDFLRLYSIAESKFDQFFGRMKDERFFVVIAENKHKLISWLE